MEDVRAPRQARPVPTPSTRWKSADAPSSGTSSPSHSPRPLVPSPRTSGVAPSHRTTVGGGSTATAPTAGPGAGERRASDVSLEEERIKAKPLPIATDERPRGRVKDDDASSDEMSPRSFSSERKSPRTLPKLPAVAESLPVSGKEAKSFRIGGQWRTASAKNATQVGSDTSIGNGQKSNIVKSFATTPIGGSTSWRSSLTASSTAPFLDDDDNDDDSDASAELDVAGVAFGGVDEIISVESIDTSKNCSDQVYTWGQKGLAAGRAPTPVLLAELGWGETVSKISCGACHFVLLTSLRRCYTWGKGANGQLGHGTTQTVTAPLLVQALNGISAELAQAGGDQTVVYTAGRECFYFGCPVGNKLGGEKPKYLPTPWPRLKGISLKSIAVGSRHVVVCTMSGDLWGWGCNVSGELGALSVTDAFVSSPIEVDCLKKVVFIVAGEDCTAAVNNLGHVYLWGNATIRGKTGISGPKAVQIKFPRAVNTVALGSRHLVALGRLGEVWTLGHGDAGQLGSGKMGFVSDACLVSFEGATELNLEQTASVAAAAGPSAASSGSGLRVAPLDLKTSQLDSGGAGSFLASPSNSSDASKERKPTLFQRIFTKEVAVPMAGVAAGQGFSAAVSLEGKVYFWGTDPNSRDVIPLPFMFPELRNISVGSLACGLFASAITVDLQDTADLIFHSYNPPILRAATITGALEFLFGNKGSKSPQLEFIFLNLWHTFCDVTEILSALHWTWTSLVTDTARQRMISFVPYFVQENMVRINNDSSFGAQLKEWLVETGQESALKIFHSIPSFVAIPALLPGFTTSEAAFQASVKKAVGPLLPDLLSYSAETCAEQLALIDHHLLGAISCSELLERGWTKKDKDRVAPNVMAVILRFNMFADFVRADIVMGKDVATRSRRLRFWVDVQKQCFNLNNFHSVMSLSGAIGSVAVRKLLKHDLVELTRSHRRWLEFIEEEFRSRNMKGYRTKVVAALKESEPAVPFLATHLGDLVFIHEGNPDTLEGGLINMYKRYLLARQLVQIRRMQEIHYSALKKSEELHRFLLNPPVEWDEQKCDEMVEKYLHDAAAALVVAPAISASDNSILMEHSTAIDSASKASVFVRSNSAPQPSALSVGDESGVVSLAVAETLSPDNAARLRAEGRAEPDARLGIWNGWVQLYVSKKEEYALAWCKSQALEELIHKSLVCPLSKEEEPVLETVLSFFLVKGVDIRRLIELLHAASVSEPEREVRDRIVSIFASLKANATALYAPSSLPPVPSLSDVSSSSDDAAFLIVENSCMAMVSTDKGPAAAFGHLAHVLRSKVHLMEVRDVVQAPFAAQKRQLQELLAQRDAGKLERSHALIHADKAIGEAQEKLKAVQEREAALRAQLDACIAERLELERDFFKAKGSLDTTCRQQNQRILILTANIEHQEREVQTRARVMTALDAVLENVSGSQSFWTTSASDWIRPLEERLSLLEMYFFHLEERLQSLASKLRANMGVADATMWITLDKIRSLADSTKVGPYALLVAQVEGMPTAASASLKQGKLEKIATLAARVESACRDLHAKFSAGANN